MSTRKIAKHESERSPEMRMRQYILKMRLEKDVGRLNKSEKLLSNRITMDQKIVCKRFRKKIHASKLAFARITGNKDLEEELTDEMTLNTDLGNEINKDELLRKIWRAGSDKYAEQRRREAIHNSRELYMHNSIFNSTSSTERNEAIQQVENAKRQSLSARESMKTSRFASRTSIASPSFLKRPFTSFENRIKENYDEGSVYEDDNMSKTHSTEDLMPEQKENVASTETKPKRMPPGSACVVVNHIVRPKTAATVMETKRNCSNKKGRPANESTTHTAIGSFFEEEKKPTLLELHKQRLKEAKFELRIRDFDKQVTSLRLKDCPMKDYYAVRLATETQMHKSQKTLNFAHLVAGAVPEEEYLRWRGNTELTSITLKSVTY